MAEEKKAGMFRRVIAAILDFFTIFIVGGMAIATLTGDTTGAGFKLDGIPALILFALMIAYFVIGSRYLGGTLWQRILKTR